MLVLGVPEYATTKAPLMGTSKARAKLGDTTAVVAASARDARSFVIVENTSCTYSGNGRKKGSRKK
jgi:hypothetical protein